MTGLAMAATDEAWVRAEFARVPTTGGDTRALLAELVSRRCPLLDRPAVSAAVERLHALVAGLGPLDELLRDPLVTDVLVNGPGRVWVERDGRLVATDVVLGESDISLVVERAFHGNGLSVDRAHPVGDTRLRDGARISVVLPPLALDGTHIAIRRFADRTITLDGFGGPEVTDVLRRSVQRRANIVVFGATGAGKTSLVNALASAIPPHERVVSIEDAAELRLPLPHVVRLECRPDNGDGAGSVDLRRLVRAALRLRPDRLVVGEVRGPEALDMVWALATGHDGSLSTCHARSASDLLARIETFVMLADAALPMSAVRAQVRAAVDIVVGVERRGPHRAVTSVHEVVADPTHASGLTQVWP